MMMEHREGNQNNNMPSEVSTSFNIWVKDLDEKISEQIAGNIFEWNRKCYKKG